MASVFLTMPLGSIIGGGSMVKKQVRSRGREREIERGPKGSASPSRGRVLVRS